MGRRLLHCRNPECSVLGGAVLGRITASDGLVLSTEVADLRCYLDARRAVIGCPACGSLREFRGASISTDRVRR